MKPSDFQKTVQCRFESCLKKVVRHVVKDYQQGLKRRKDKEIPFCELPDGYYGAAEPPVRCGESHLSGLTEPPQFVY